MVIQLEKHLEVAEVKSLGVGSAGEDARDPFADANQQGKRIGYHQGPDGRPQDDQQFGRLHQDQKLAMFHRIASRDGAKHHDNSDDGNHWINLLRQ